MNAPRIHDVEAAVCGYFGRTRDDMQQPKRAKRYARPRQIAMYLAMEMTDSTLEEIGRHFCRDHSTVGFAVERIAQLQTANPKIAKYVTDCRQRIEEHGNRLAAASRAGSMGEQL